MKRCFFFCALLICLCVRGVTDAFPYGITVTEDSGALRAGDCIRAINGRKIANAADLGRHWQSMRRGEKYSLAVDRGNYSFTLELVR